MRTKIVNLDYLEEMSGGDRNLIIEMIDLFISEVPGYLSLMNEYLYKGNWESLGKLAHKAKASASIMGLNDLADDLKKLEHQTVEGTNTQAYPDQVQIINQQFNRATEELKQIVKTL
jgi:HPt (histidine-containing phosphotransfer) domain-containing protein